MDNGEKKPSGWRLRENEELRAAALASKPLGDSFPQEAEKSGDCLDCAIQCLR